MEELTFEGKIEDIAIKPKKPEGEFVKLKVNGKTFNFFDMGFYEKNKPNFKIGAEISIVYMVNTFSTDEGTRTSNTANAIAFTGIKSPITQKTVEVFQEEKDEGSVEIIMEKCLYKSFNMLNDLGKRFDIMFTPEDVRTVGVAMFIEACKRGR